MAGKNNDKSVRQDIYERIRDDITYGRLMPGERLTEKKLSDIYAVSRSPIREALRQLQSEGLIRFEQNKGMEVPKLSIKQVEEIYDIRALLEGYAVRMSVAHLTQDDLRHLAGLHKRLIKAARDKDTQTWFDNNALFHGYFREKAGNETLNQLIILLRRRTFLYQNISLSFERYYEAYIEHHSEILEACKKKDPVLADTAMQNHVRTTRKAVIEYLSISRNSLI
jgi:DNA-binding GntR family transcriptional regulator